MKSRIRKTFTDNWEFKLLAVFFACIMWLVVYNTKDPITTKQFTTTVTIENEEALIKMNKYYEVLNGSNQVSFYVSAKRSDLEKLDDSCFTAVADMNNMVVDETGEKATVKINIAPKPAYYYAKPKGTKYLELSLEQLMSKSFNITPKTTGNLADGYALGKVSLVKNIVRVDGPESVVKTIDSVVASLDVEGLSQDMTNQVLLKLYDKEGNEVDQTRLTPSISEVTMSVQVLSTKEVKVNFSTSGTPAGQNKVLGIESNPSTVLIKGTPSALNGVNSIDVPADVLSVANAVEDINTQVDITEYLPEGVSLVNPEDANISVIVKIKSYGKQTVNLSTDNISIKGLSEDYELLFEKSNVAIEVAGADTDLEELTAETLKGSIDVSAFGEGNHNVVVTLNLDSTKYTYDTVTVKITIRKKQTGNNDNDGGNDDNGGQDDADPQGDNN